VRRFLLIAALFAFAWLMLRRMFGTVSREAGSGRDGRPGARRQGSTELVRDRVCNTFIPRTRALTLEEGGRTHYFCSEECRSRHQAGTGGSRTEELAS